MKQMNREIFVCGALIFVILFTCLPVLAKTKKASSAALPPEKYDYVSALATANRFLNTWQSQDEDAGMVMLTNDAKHRITESQLEAFFSPGTNSGYEINRGKKLSWDRFSFPVVLFVTIGKKGVHHPRFSQIVLIKTGSDDWAVDKLP
jgi:hypothetical protein